MLPFGKGREGKSLYYHLLIHAFLKDTERRIKNLIKLVISGAGGWDG